MTKSDKKFVPVLWKKAMGAKETKNHPPTYTENKNDQGEHMAENYGYLQIFVRTATGSLPIVGAAVTVTGNGESHTLLTDRSGKTDRLTLPAPSAENSLRAEQKDPFSLYRVRVEKEGFYTQTTENVPVFPGIASLQPVTLIGLAEYGSAQLSPVSSTDTVKGDPQVLNR